VTPLSEDAHELMVVYCVMDRCACWQGCSLEPRAGPWCKRF